MLTPMLVQWRETNSNLLNVLLVLENGKCLLHLFIYLNVSCLDFWILVMLSDHEFFVRSSNSFNELLLLHLLSCCHSLLHLFLMRKEGLVSFLLGRKYAEMLELFTNLCHI